MAEYRDTVEAGAERPRHSYMISQDEEIDSARATPVDDSMRAAFDKLKDKPRPPSKPAADSGGGRLGKLKAFVKRDKGASSGGGGDSDGGKSFGGKMKGLFSKKDKDKDSTSMGSRVALDDTRDEINANVLPKRPVVVPHTFGMEAKKSEPVRPEKPKQSVLNMLTPVSNPPPGEARPGDELAVLNYPKQRPICRAGNVLNFMLLLGVIMGIFFIAFHSFSPLLQYVGPCILGLSIFAICGKVFFGFLFEDDPVPFMNPYVKKYNDYFTEQQVADTRYKAPTALSTSFYSYGQAQTGGVRSDLNAYRQSPIPPQPIVYDRSIDTRPITS